MEGSIKNCTQCDEASYDILDADSLRTCEALVRQKIDFEEIYIKQHNDRLLFKDMNKVVEVLERKTVFVTLKTYPTRNPH
ncbi:hypothetical protein Mp_Mg00240 (mitochondrion) [Marchantia polymorpha subsp. ruderalis]|uniref:Uncharacterized protein n=2 Tax=Marchantia polymorpha TaxID=3197 RepID=A0A2Z6DTE6_MARPO|nr:hypothetical protein MpKit2_Mp014 [Marchantia polymorpha subsp. ruderalis]QBE89543.1 hypothetical protein [Marchantia polymorpha subsp. ruderalis]BBD75151.1 hypothetical protein MpKit2_Mp014 [Marchantia polymorpha subsp. ruderalis]BBM97940.1 hypothetical protein Mp_1g09630 [Marchantia polymorpha subsp. ruderalis]BDD77334.1 hypothetical protein Mp_Mg00240 [Marchantia polymorpha subsp. ruderalis]